MTEGQERPAQIESRAAMIEDDRLLHTTAGTFPLQAYHLRLAGRAWTILHTGAILSRDDESRFLGELSDKLPYGVALWPSAIALAHEIAERAAAFAGKQVLELGAGTGLPGIVAGSLGARVIQTDRQEMALTVCERNGVRNGVGSIAYRLVDWADWDDQARYDWIIGSDILYAEGAHGYLRRILETALAPGGQILLADPFRAASIRLLEALETEGWTITFSKWQIGEAEGLRPIGLFALTPPR